MKTIKFKLLILCSILFLSARPAQAKGGIPIIYSSGEDIVKVKDLPLREEFQIQAEDGNWYPANLGIKHKQFSLVFIPLYNYGEEEYVLYTDKKVGNTDYTYVDLTPDDIEYLQSEIGGIPSTPELPFWDVWGGKLLVLALIIILGYFKNS